MELDRAAVEVAPQPNRNVRLTPFTQCNVVLIKSSYCFEGFAPERHVARFWEVNRTGILAIWFSGSQGNGAGRAYASWDGRLVEEELCIELCKSWESEDIPPGSIGVRDDGGTGDSHSVGMLSEGFNDTCQPSWRQDCIIVNKRNQSP